MYKKTLQEFKDFAVKGNVVDLAIAVIIGGAFSKIVSSLVNDLVMPVFGYMLGGVKFSNLIFKLGDNSIKYGNFVQTIVDFLIIAFSIFLAVKLITRFKKKKEVNNEEKVKINKEEELLKEIRDILKNNNKH
jgi:large conductance mechanosensitive channel